ncbi:MAG: tetratricopeptide repeat protein [Acidobacteriota bacterium]
MGSLRRLHARRSTAAACSASPHPVHTQRAAHIAQPSFARDDPWLLPCPAIGAWVLARTHRALAAGLAAAAAITAVYAVNYDIPWEIDVYFIPVVLAMTIAAAAGLERLGALLGGGAAALPAIALLPLIAGYHLNDRSRHTIVEAYGRDILACAPQGATVIAPETDAAFALLYLTTVRGERPDVTVWVNTAEGARPLARALAPTVRPVPLERVAAESRAPVVLCEPPPPRSGIGLEIEPSGVVYRVASRRVPSAPPFDFSRFALDAIVRSGPPFALDDRSRIILSKYLFARGDARRLGGDRDAAHNDYDAAAMRAPDAAETWIDLASRQEALGDPAAAIASVQRGLALRDDAMFENRLARLLIDAGRRDEAMAALRRAIAIDPDLAIAHSNLGGLLGMRGDGTGAVRELEIAVRLDPESSMAAKNLAQAYMMVGDRRRAAEAIQRAIALHPGQPDLLAIRAAIGDR